MPPSEDSCKDSYDPQLSGTRVPSQIPRTPQEDSSPHGRGLQGLDPHGAELWLQRLAPWLGESHSH